MNTRPHACQTKYFFNEFHKKITAEEALGQCFEIQDNERECVKFPNLKMQYNVQSLENYRMDVNQDKQIQISKATFSN